MEGAMLWWVGYKEGLANLGLVRSGKLLELIRVRLELLGLASLLTSKNP